MNLYRDYKLLKENLAFKDIMSYIQETLELNRDVLEGLKVAEGESDEVVKGWSRGLRQLLRYIDVQSEKEIEHDSE